MRFQWLLFNINTLFILDYKPGQPHLNDQIVHNHGLENG